MRYFSTFYDNLKTKEKNYERELNYIQYLDNVLISMFDYTNLPEHIPTFAIEQILTRYGCIGAMLDTSNNLQFFSASLVGDIDDYGLGNMVIGATTKEQYSGVLGVDACVGWNNSTLTNDFDIYRIANNLSEIDKSLELNILYARNYPIPKVRDSKEALIVEKAISNMREGKESTIISKNNPFEDDEITDILNISDVNTADKIQYIAHYKDDVLRWFFNRYGHPMQSTSKMAQQTTKEISGNDSVCWITPLDKLRQREKFIENVNKMFGTNIEVGFSPAWKTEYEKFLNVSRETL